MIALRRFDDEFAGKLPRNRKRFLIRANAVRFGIGSKRGGACESLACRWLPLMMSS